MKYFLAPAAIVVYIIVAIAIIENQLLERFNNSHGSVSVPLATCILGGLVMWYLIIMAGREKK